MSYRGAPTPGMVTTSVGAGGTTGKIPKFTAAYTVGDSLMAEAASSITVTGSLKATSALEMSNGSTFQFTGSSGFSAVVDGTIKLHNNANSDFGRIMLGGTTSSFPAIKRSAAEIAIRLADDSANASLIAQTIRGTVLTYATLPAVPVEGMFATISDGSTAAWGAACIGGGANRVGIYYNGTAWTVVGK